MGFGVLALGTVLTVAGLVLTALGYATDGRAGWIVLLIATGQAVAVASVTFVREPDAVSFATTSGGHLATSRRRMVGFWLLALHIGLYLVVWVGGVLSYTRATTTDPFPTVFGLAFESQGPAFVWGVVLAEALFVAALYALGPAWRRRYAQLFRYAPSGATATTDRPSPPTTWRYKLGLGVFAVGNLLAVSGLVLPALGLATGRMVGVIAVMLGAGEVLSLSSIFFLGKAGFKELKSKLFAVMKRTPSGEPISQRRFRVGCTLLAFHVALQFAALVFPVASHYGVSVQGAFPEVLGLGREDQLGWFVGLLAAAEVLFFAGLYTLGGDWWDRFQSLFAPPDALSEGLRTAL